MEGADEVRYVCTVCKKEALHNEVLGIHFCKKHGFKTKPAGRRGFGS